MSEATGSGEASKKPKLDDSDDEEGWVGPMPSEAAQPKRKKSEF